MELRLENTSRSPNLGWLKYFRKKLKQKSNYTRPCLKKVCSPTEWIFVVECLESKHEISTIINLTEPPCDEILDSVWNSLYENV